MGSTHTRSNFKEQTTGLKIAFSNASIVTATITTAAITTLTTTTSTVTTSNVTTLNVANNYIKLGTDVYIMRVVGAGKPSAFSTAVLNGLATALTGGTATRVGKGSLFLTASSTHVGSACFLKYLAATWCNVTLGAAV